MLLVCWRCGKLFDDRAMLAPFFELGHGNVCQRCFSGETPRSEQTAESIAFDDAESHRALLLARRTRATWKKQQQTLDDAG